MTTWATIFADSEDYLKTHTSGTLDYAIWQTMAQESKKLKAIKGGREILKKFDIALFSARRKGLARTKKPHPYEEIDLLNTFHDADLLINLRNAYVHYIPKWRAVLSNNLLVEAVNEKEIDALREDPATKKAKFATNRLLPVGPMRPFFPEICLGHGCATWAVNASIQFAEEFYREINKELSLTSPLDSISKQRLRLTP